MATSANSAIVHLAGNSVDFSYDDSTLFGTANVIGDSIFFLPTNFKAESRNGAGAVTTNETLNITIQATAGHTIDTVVLHESGDYRLSGAGASASVNGLLAVTSHTKLDGLFPFREQQLFDAGVFSDTGAFAQEWNTVAEIDMTTIAGWSNDTFITVTAENLLSATTLYNGELAFVEKKYLGIGLVVNPVNPVPVPAALWLFGSGLLGLAGLVAKRRR